MSQARSGTSLIGLALDGLRRKLGRNLLTAGGVFVGVFALTMIVSLGEGMTSLIRSAVSGEANLRQIGLSGGLGTPLEDDAEIVIEGEMSGARRERLARAARARTRPSGFIGRRAQTLDAETLQSVAALEHVEKVVPIVLERYRSAMGEHELPVTTTIGVDAESRRYATRLLAGTWFTTPDADEVLLHEYLAYRWGFVTEASLIELVGREIRLEPLGLDDAEAQGPAGIAGEVLARLDLSALTEEEREVLPRIVGKLGRALLPAGTPTTAGAPRSFRIAGVLREMEATDTFHVIEDGNAVRADLFLPQATAESLFLSTAVNREMGFSRAYVQVDAASRAQEVEDELRERGFTAFSVASVVSRIEGLLTALTVIVGLLTGIALLVAAMGIVNTMVTSVLERKREIGLWKAVGATSSQVRRVFLYEAAGLGLAGGLLGLGAALLLQIPLGGLATRLVVEQTLFPVRGSVFQMPAWLPIAGPALATLVAVLAALYPAHRAARLDPVRALRDE